MCVYFFFLLNACMSVVGHRKSVEAINQSLSGLLMDDGPYDEVASLHVERIDIVGCAYIGFIDMFPTHSNSQ